MKCNSRTSFVHCWIFNPIIFFFTQKRKTRNINEKTSSANCTSWPLSPELAGSFNSLRLSLSSSSEPHRPGPQVQINSSGGENGPSHIPCCPHAKKEARKKNEQRSGQNKFDRIKPLSSSSSASVTSVLITSVEDVLFSRGSFGPHSTRRGIVPNISSDLQEN